MRIAVSAIAVLTCTSLASAADLGGPYEPYGGSLKDEPVAAAPFRWAGFYIGANVGHGWGDLDAVLPNTGMAEWLPDSIDVGMGPKGWFGGGQIGYNFQSGQVVFGLEADFQGADIDDNVTHHIEVSDPSPFDLDLDASLKVRSFGTVRGRLGWDLGRVMPYVTGGFAWANAKGKAYAPFNPDRWYIGTDSNTHTGWVLGGGLEFALAPNWIARAEYLYFDFGKETYADLFVGSDVGDPYSIDADLDFQTVRIGVNYKFGG